MECQTDIFRSGSHTIAETTRHPLWWHTLCGTATLERWHRPKNVVRLVLAPFLIAMLFAAVYAGSTPEVIYDKETKLVEQIASIVRDNKTIAT